MDSVEIRSVNVGRPAPLQVGKKRILSAIGKTPAMHPVAVGPLGLEGDAVGNRTHHGGAGQAVYLYAADDYAWWSAALNRAIEPGTFGENITLDRWWPEVRIGDRLRLDALVLEISFPRIPCATLAARMGDNTFLKAFVKARRPGHYARVIHPGAVKAGERFVLQRATPGHPESNALFELWHTGHRDTALMQRALDAPLAERARAAFEKWLSEAGEPAAADLKPG